MLLRSTTQLILPYAFQNIHIYLMHAMRAELKAGNLRTLSVFLWRWTSSSIEPPPARAAAPAAPVVPRRQHRSVGAGASCTCIQDKLAIQHNSKINLRQQMQMVKYSRIEQSYGRKLWARKLLTGSR